MKSNAGRKAKAHEHKMEEKVIAEAAANAVAHALITSEKAAAARPKQKKKKQKKKKSPSLGMVPGTGRNFGNHTVVLGTGVEVPRDLTGRPPSRVMSANGRECRYTCIDWVGSITIPANQNANPVGHLLYQLPLAPALVPNTRLNIESQLWEKFQVEDWSFAFITTQGTTVSGQLIAFVDPDPRDDWTDESYNIAKAAAQFGSMPINVWQHFHTRLPIGSDTERTTYFTNPVSSSDVRFTQPGVLRVINAGGFQNSSNGTQIYNIYQRATLKFIDPELSITSSTTRTVAEITGGNPSAAFGNTVLNGSSKIAGGVPMTLLPDGTLTIDTSNIGDNNLVIEARATVSNPSDVNCDAAIDFGIAEALDELVSVVNVYHEAGFEAGLEASTQIILDGTRSWQVRALWLGASVLAAAGVYFRFWVVPRRVNTIQKAAKHLNLVPLHGALSRPPRIVGVTPSWFTSTSSYVLNADYSGYYTKSTTGGGDHLYCPVQQRLHTSTSSGMKSGDLIVRNNGPGSAFAYNNLRISFRLPSTSYKVTVMMAEYTNFSADVVLHRAGSLPGHQNLVENNTGYLSGQNIGSGTYYGTVTEDLRPIGTDCALDIPICTLVVPDSAGAGTYNFQGTIRCCINIEYYQWPPSEPLFDGPRERIMIGAPESNPPCSPQLGFSGHNALLSVAQSPSPSYAKSQQKQLETPNFRF